MPRTVTTVAPAFGDELHPYTQSDPWHRDLSPQPGRHGGAGGIARCSSYTAGLHNIVGFDAAQDLVTFSAALFANFAAVQAHDVAYQGGTFIALGQNAGLILQGILPAQLSASNFAFV